MRATGRKYGLRADWWVDERYDPVSSTKAAIAYLKDLHNMFGDWYLALASYNAGEGRLMRATKTLKTKDFWRIARTRYIRAETKGYIPAFIAAVKVCQDPTRYGLEPPKPENYHFEMIRVKPMTDLKVIAKCCGIKPEAVSRLNPGLLRNLSPPGSDALIRKRESAGSGTGLEKAKRCRASRHATRPPSTP
jgi:membrane-bound lytic murein transglycosylase D